MVSLIVGEKGKGKTKYLLDMANEAVKTAAGNIVYIDKNGKHMYELNNKVRLIDASRYPLKSGDEFIGFICGIASQDHDLERIFLDSFLKNAKLVDNSEGIREYIAQLETISKLCKVDFILSVSKNKEDLDPAL
ncbi:MAG: twitching motility protein PilT, partial [Clostridia bacterium]|nr:twitching motility protein PilT [Clostridia bacterium]